MAYPTQARVGNRLDAFRLGYYIEVKAYLDARSGIARSGASRSDYYSKLNTVITIGGVDCSHAIRYGTLRITEALNDQPDSAAFTLLPNPPTIPRVGDHVRVGLGTVENLEFGGRIGSVQHTREAAQNPPFLNILCTDYMPDFDQRLVNYSWPTQSASTTILDLIARFCQDGDPFTTFGVKPNMPTLEAFEVVNARPSDVMRRIVTLCNGGFYVGPGRDVHAWPDGPEPGYPDPAPLSLRLVSLKSFAHVEDGAQARTAIVVEGPRTTALAGLPWSSGLTSASVGTIDYGIPIGDAAMFRGQSNFEARVGSQRVRVSTVNPAFNPMLPLQGQISVDIPAATVLSWVTPTFADGGAFLADVVLNTWIWVKVGDTYGVILNNGGTKSLLVGAVGQYYFAAITTAITAGTPVTKVDSFSTLTGEAGVIGSTPGAVPIRAQPVGAEVIGVLRRGTSNSYSWPPKNVEHLISDGRLSFAGMQERAINELDDFDHVEITAEWDTEDPNARIGRKQVIELEDPDALATTLTIFTSEITFPVADHAPRRHNTGGTVKHANILDILLTEKD